MFATALLVADRRCTRELLKRKSSLNDCTVLCFSEIEGFREHVEVTAYVVRLYAPCGSLAGGTGEGYCRYHHHSAYI